MDHVTEFVIKATRSHVFSGPFEGMRMSSESAWSSLDLPSRFLGTYEQDLHQYILAMRSNDYDCVMDIGCADGYYAVGLAMLYPNVKVIAYDTDPRAQTACLNNARINDVASRVSLRTFCDSTELQRVCRQYKRPFVFCDCEGYEVELFSSPDTIQALSNADLIIEMHEFSHPGCTSMIRSQFLNTHDVTEVRDGRRNHDKFSILTSLSEADRHRAMREYRPAVMNWLICTKKPNP